MSEAEQQQSIVYGPAGVHLKNEPVVYEQAGGNSWRILGVEGENTMLLELSSEWGTLRYPFERPEMNDILIVYVIMQVNSPNWRKEEEKK